MLPRMEIPFDCDLGDVDVPRLILLRDAFEIPQPVKPVGMIADHSGAWPLVDRP